MRAVPFTWVTAGSASVLTRCVKSMNGLAWSHPNNLGASSSKQTGAIGRNYSRCLISFSRTLVLSRNGAARIERFPNARGPISISSGCQIVDVPRSRGFFGGMKAEGFDHGIFVLVEGCTEEARQFAHDHGITILDATMIPPTSWCDGTPRSARAQSSSDCI